MWLYKVRRRSCDTHCATEVVRYFSKYELMAPIMAIARTLAAAKLRMANLSVPATEWTIVASQSGIRFDPSTLSKTIFNGHGSSRAVTLSPSTAINACLLYTSDAADERSSVDLGG